MVIFIILSILAGTVVVGTVATMTYLQIKG